MFRWFERWRERAAEGRIERLLAEVKSYRERWHDEHGDEPFPLTPEARRELKKLRDQLTPEARKLIDPDDFLGLDHDPGAESP